MRVVMSLHFFLRRPKVYSKGPVPVYLRITIDKSRTELVSGFECDPTEWSPEVGRATGRKESIRKLNAQIEKLQSQVQDVFDDLVRTREDFDAMTVKNKLNGVGNKKIMILDVFSEHNEKVQALVGKEFAAQTLDRYKTSLKHTRDFILWKYKVEDMEVTKINHLFISEYDFYLRSVRNCANNSTVKYIKNFAKIIRICMANGWIVVNPLLNYKPKVKMVDRVFLTDGELLAIAEKEFEIERLTQVRDIFLFSCYTGLAYVDVQKLKKSDIVTGVDGGLWIHTFRQKTRVATRIPLLPPARNILNRYNDHPKCETEGKVMPVPTNQKMNAYLKEIASVCGITKELTFHIARHTFATTVTLNNGIPMETVSKMLGHTNIKTTQHYAKILDMKVSQDMAVLNKKYSS
jgi:integrase